MKGERAMYFGNDYWLMPYHDKDGKDVREVLIKMGFKINHLHNDLLCNATPPEGWAKKGVKNEERRFVPSAFPISTGWTEGKIISDQNGTPRILVLYYHSDEEELFDDDLGWLSIAADTVEA